MHSINNTFKNFVLEHKVIGVSDVPFTLASGKSSHFYVNWREVCDELSSFCELMKMIVPVSQREFPLAECFYGVPEGGTKLGLFLQYEIFSKRCLEEKRPFPFSMGRAKPKDRGPITHRNFLGAPKGYTVLVEDVATTGESLLNALESLKKVEGCRPYGVLVLTDREQRMENGQSLKQVIEGQNLKYFSFSYAKELLKILDLNQEMAQKISLEFSL